MAMNWEAMTPKEKRILVAETAGYVRDRRDEEKWGKQWWSPIGPDGKSPGTVSEDWLPQSLTDLNVMHELEQKHIVTSIPRMQRYRELLDAFTMTATNDSGHFATAENRARAFVQVMQEIG